MPLYTYRNPSTNESIDVIQRMSDEHVYVDDDGLQWERVWSIPQATMGLNNSADSESQFIDKPKAGPREKCGITLKKCQRRERTLGDMTTLKTLMTKSVKTK